MKTNHSPFTISGYLRRMQTMATTASVITIIPPTPPPIIDPKDSGHVTCNISQTC